MALGDGRRQPISTSTWHWEWWLGQVTHVPREREEPVRWNRRAAQEAGHQPWWHPLLCGGILPSCRENTSGEMSC